MASTTGPFWLHRPFLPPQVQRRRHPTRMHGDNKPIRRGCRNPANHLRTNRQPEITRLAGSGTFNHRRKSGQIPTLPQLGFAQGAPGQAAPGQAVPRQSRGGQSEPFTPHSGRRALYGPDLARILRSCRRSPALKPKRRRTALRAVWARAKDARATLRTHESTYGSTATISKAAGSATDNLRLATDHGLAPLRHRLPAS